MFEQLFISLLLEQAPAALMSASSSGFLHVFLWINSLCLGEIYSSVVIDIGLDYMMCLIAHLISVGLLESTVRGFIMRAGWWQLSFS